MSFNIIDLPHWWQTIQIAYALTTSIHLSIFVIDTLRNEAHSRLVSIAWSKMKMEKMMGSDIQMDQSETFTNQNRIK